MKNRKRKVKIGPKSLKKLIEKAHLFKQTNQLPKAVQCYKQYLASAPTDANILNDLGTAYYLQNNYSAASSCYQKVLKLSPEHPHAHYNLANIYTITHQIEQAISHYQMAISKDPGNIDALNNLATIYYDQGDIGQAEKLFKHSLAFAPHNHQNRSIVISAQNYLPDVPAMEQFHLAKEWWTQHGKPVFHKILYRNTPTPTRQLNIGCLSPDFREHSIAYFFIPLIEHLDKDLFTITCYSDTTNPDHITEKICTFPDKWRETSRTTDAQLARIIEQDGIDILIDLTGHMINNRLLVFARQPAPVQISWLGYPNTTGLPTIHYRLTDEIADPTGKTDSCHSEKLIRMTNGFLCYAPPEECPVIQPKNVSPKTITFASFNNPAKINHKTIQTWAAILKALPKAKLLLKGKLLDSPMTQKKLSRKFSNHGAYAAQITYLPFSQTTQEHLDLYNMVDICLDTFPYNGTTTTCEALWMGVPVITLLGEQHAARVGASLLHRVGLSELIAPSEKDYIDLAVQISQDHDCLRKWRTNLRSSMRNSSLCDAPKFARAMEQVFRQTWYEWCQSQSKQTTISR